MKATARRHLPDANRLSVLAATFILAYGMSHFIVLPVREFDIQFPGIYLSAQVGVHTLITLLVAGLAASGSDWLLRDHPKLAKKSVWRYILLPALTAWVIGFPLSQLPYGIEWWFGLTTGSLLLILVITAEYIAIDPEDTRYPLAAAWLSAISFILFLILAIALRAAYTRLIFTLPALAIASFLVSLRALHLRLHGEWLTLEALLTSFLTLQIAAALHYWPLTPIQAGSILLGTIYSITSLIAAIVEENTLKQALVEPIIAITIAIIIAIWQA